MQVTRHNLSLVLQDFKRDLQKCDFVAMDQEMCGIQRQGKEAVRSMTPVEAWTQPFFAARTYIAFQCGLCLCRVKRDNNSSSSGGSGGGAGAGGGGADGDAPATPTTATSPGSAAAAANNSSSSSGSGTSISLTNSTHRLELKPYNFWLRQHGRHAPDVQLNMDAIDFLSRNQMDFNTWLKDGMEYCGGVTAETHRSKMLPRAYPKGANDVAVSFARYIKAIVVEQWYRGMPVDLSASFVEFCASNNAASSSSETADATDCSEPQQQQPKKSKKEKESQKKDASVPAATAAARDADSAQADLEASRKITAVRRILAGCSTGGGSSVCAPPGSTTPPLGGAAAAAASSLSAPQQQLGKQTSITGSGILPALPSTSTASRSSESGLLATTCEPQRVLTIAASPDGTLVAGGTADGTVKVWSVLAMQHTSTLKIQQQQQQQSSSSSSSSSGDKKKKSSASSSSSRKEAPSSSVASSSTSHFSITTLAFHPNSAFVAAGTSLGYVALWDISTAIQVQHIPFTSSAKLSAASPPGVAALKFDLRGLNLAVVTASGIMAVWDVVRATYVATPRSCSFWEEEEEEYGEEEDDDQKQQQQQQQEEGTSCDAAPVVSFLQYSSDGSMLLLGFVNDRRVQAYRATTLEPAPSFFLPKELLTCRSGIGSGQQENQKCLSFVTVVAPNGRICAAPNMPVLPIKKQQQQKRVSPDRDDGGVDTGAAAAAASAASPNLEPSSHHHDANSNNSFAIALCECQVAVTLTKHELKEKSAAATAAAAASSSASSSAPTTPRFLVGHVAPVTGLDFSADSRHILSTSVFDGTARLWDVEALMTTAAAAADESASSSSSSLIGVPLIVLQQGPRLLPTSVLGSLISAMRIQGRALGRCFKKSGSEEEQEEQQLLERLNSGGVCCDGEGFNPTLLFRGGGGGTGAVCFTGRSGSVASCTCTDANVSVWDTHRGAFNGGVVSVSLECVTVCLPDRASSELPALLQTDLMLGKCDVELDRKHVGGRYVFRRRGPGFHEQLLRKRQEELTERLGFRLFFEALKESKKPILGHHFTSDLAFFVNQHECGVREDFAWFKRTVHALFPSVYDTKAIAARFGAAHTNLEDLFSRRQGGRFPVEMHLPMAFMSYHPNVSKAVNNGQQQQSSSSSSVGAAVAHQGAYDAMMTAVVFWSFVQEHPTMLAEMENAISFFGINYWMTLGSNYDFLAWCQVIMVEHPHEAFQGEAHIREFLDGTCPGVVEEVPGAFVQFIRQGSVFNIVVRPHASASRIEALCQKLVRAGFKQPKQLAGKVSSVSMSSAVATAAAGAAPALAASQSSEADGGAAGSAGGASAGNAGGGAKLTKKQRREQQKLHQAQAAQQQALGSANPAQRSRAGSQSDKGSQMGDDGDRQDSGE